MADLRLVGVMDKDPFDYRTWSGSSRYLFTTLDERGVLINAVDAQPSRAVTTWYQLASIQPDRARWGFRYHNHTGYYRKMSEAALRHLDEIERSRYNTILQVGAWYNLGARKDKLLASYHDGNLATLLASPFGYPPIRQRHLRESLAWEKAVYDGIDCIFPMSRWLAESFMRDFQVPADKLHPVGAGINLPRIADTAGRGYEARNILFVGREFERKGGGVLLGAFSKVRRAITAATLTLIGPTLHEVPEGVQALGFVSKKDEEGIATLLDAYSRASLFVLPSLYEPFGISFAEAMAHRVPCIGTRNCAIPEIIDEEVNGFLVPPNDEDALAVAIIAVLDEPGALAQLGAAAYAKYETHYTWPIVVDKMTRTLEELLV
jgi:glycosyltransferase involved in cell wall biosynthesis